MKYIYQIINIPWFNSTVDVWPDGASNNKTRNVVPNFKKNDGTHNIAILISHIRNRYNISPEIDIEVEEYIN